VTVTEEITLPFGRSAAEDFDLLRRLRDATSDAVRLRWILGGLPSLPLRSYVHLVPPLRGVDEATAEHARGWQADYRYGSYFYREGPGFVTVKDVRPGEEPRRLTIDEGSEHFLAMTTATTVADLDPEATELLEVAEEAELVIRQGDLLLTLPYRLRHWPVPYVAI
jgi:hypothetical protein